MEKVTLHVEGMSCGHCVKAVEESVAKLQGVSEVTVNLDNGTVDVKFDANTVKIGTLKETIDEQGYDAK